MRLARLGKYMGFLSLHVQCLFSIYTTYNLLQHLKEHIWWPWAIQAH